MCVYERIWKYCIYVYIVPHLSILLSYIHFVLSTLYFYPVHIVQSLQTYAEVTVEQSNELPHLSLAEQPVKYSEIVVQPVHPPRPHIPPKPSSKLSPHTPNAMFGSLSQHTNDRKDKHPLGECTLSLVHPLVHVHIHGVLWCFVPTCIQVFSLFS